MVKNLPASAGDVRDTVQSLGQEDLLEKEMATTLVFLPGKSHGQRNLAGYSLGLQRVGQILQRNSHTEKGFGIFGNHCFEKLYQLCITYLLG